MQTIQVLLIGIWQQPAELLSSSSVHGGSFTGLRAFRQVKQGLARANSARREAPVPKSPPRPKVNDFITRTERAKQEQATAEAAQEAASPEVATQAVAELTAAVQEQALRALRNLAKDSSANKVAIAGTIPAIIDAMACRYLA